MTYEPLTDKQYRTASVLLASNTKVTNALTTLTDTADCIEEINVEFRLGTTEDGEFTLLLNDGGVYFTLYDWHSEYRSIKD